MIALWIGLAAVVVSICVVILSVNMTLPPYVVGYYDALFGYMYDGLGILDFFVPLEYVRAFFVLWLTLHAAYFTYSVVRWFMGFVK